MNRLHIIALCCDYLMKIRNCGIQFFAMIFLLDQDNNDCQLQLITFYLSEKVKDFSTIVDTNMAMISKALHNCALFVVEISILVSISSFLLTITMWLLQIFSAPVAFQGMWSGPRISSWLSKKLAQSSFVTFLCSIFT